MEKRNSLAAVGLGLLSPGLGHIYLGRPGRFLIPASIAALSLMGLGYVGYLSTFYGAVIYLALLILLVLFSTIDSFVMARKQPAAAHWYNRWYVYALWFALTAILFFTQPVIRELFLGFNIYRTAGSARPLLSPDEIFLVDTRAYRKRGPDVGDIVVTRRRETGSIYEKYQDTFYRNIHVVRVSARPSEKTFSYIAGQGEIEQQHVPLGALVGKPSFILFSDQRDRIGLDLVKFSESERARRSGFEKDESVVDCRGTDDDALASCLAMEVWSADQRINQLYKELLERSTDQRKKTLRDEQRSWLRMRDSTCRLDIKESNREKWILAVARDYQKTVCAVRLTKKRIGTLEAYQKTGASGSEPLMLSVPSAMPETPQSYTSLGKLARSNGRWYFEARINMAELGKYGNASLYIGLEDQFGNGYGKLLYAHNKLGQRDVISFGYAVDLENGKLYRSVNGEWVSGPPGSAKGMDLKLNRRYVVKATSSAPIFSTPQSAESVVSINIGEKAFEYALPPGYRPFNGQ